MTSNLKPEIEDNTDKFYIFVGELSTHDSLKHISVAHVQHIAEQVFAYCKSHESQVRRELIEKVKELSKKISHPRLSAMEARGTHNEFIYLDSFLICLDSLLKEQP